MTQTLGAGMDELAADIAAVSGVRMSTVTPRAVGGGDISRGWCVSDTDERNWFLKTNTAGLLELFIAEQAGLAELRQAGGIRVPQVAGYGAVDGMAWLLLDWLDMRTPSRESDALFGIALANMHRIRSEQYGWHRHNMIGATHQSNSWSSDWPVFFRDERLRPQLKLAGRNDAPESLFGVAAELLERIGELFVDYEPLPSLLHGDLWGGNRSALRDGTPVLFDPAVYYGDRETDLAMTRLFGGFGGRFYAAYREAWPLHAGHEERVILYNLYHVLNHYNLFGGAYADQAEAMIRRLLERL